VHQHPYHRETWLQLGQLIASHTHSQGAAHQAELCAASAAAAVPYPLPALGDAGARADKASQWLVARTKVRVR
jgi:hypothetical protein